MKKYFKILLPVIFCIVLSVLLVATLAKTDTKVSALSVPADYYNSTYAVSNLTSMSSGSYLGIAYLSPNTYSINTREGIITLARMSYGSTLEGLTFNISCSQLINLSINLDSSQNAISDGSFFGFGTTNYPFSATIEISGTASTVLEISGWSYLFNNISPKAQIKSAAGSSYTLQASTASTSVLTFANSIATNGCSNTTFNLSALEMLGTVINTNTDAALFSNTVTGGGSFNVDLSSIYGTNSYTVSSTASIAGGLISKIEKNNTVSLTLSSFNASVSGISSVGQLVGLCEGTFTLTGSSTISGSAKSTVDNSYVGLIGQISSNGTVNLTGSVDIDGDFEGYYVGALCGYFYGKLNINEVEIAGTVKGTSRAGGGIGYWKDNGQLSITTSVTATNQTVSKAKYLGGFVGETNTKKDILIEKVTLNNSTISSNSSSYVGGYIGRATSLTGNIVLHPKTSSFTFQNLTNTTGGIIGEVKMSRRSDACIITSTDGASITNYFGASGTSFYIGGVLGRTSSDTTTSYVKIDGLTVQNTNSNSGSKREYFGEIIGRLCTGTMASIGDVTYKRTETASNAVAQMDDRSALQLYGNLVDLSNVTHAIVYKAGNSLIYSESTFSMTYAASVENNDIGSFGQIIRNGNLNNFILLDNDTHLISFDSPLALSSSTFTISSKVDFAKLAIWTSLSGQFASVTGTTSTRIFNITFTADIDLRGTGIEQLYKSSTTEEFTGTLNGGNHTLTFAYGENVNGTQVGMKSCAADSAELRHKYLGLFTKCGNATFKNLTLEGSITFGGAATTIHFAPLVSYLDDGTISRTVLIENCTSNIVVQDNMVGGGGTAFGGFLGRTKAKSLTFTNCISNYSHTTTTSKTQFIGGFAARIEVSSSLSFSGNTVSPNMSITYPSKQGSYAAGISTVITYTGSSIIDCPFTGTTFDGASISLTNAQYSGALLAYRLENISVVLDSEVRDCNLTFTNCDYGFAFVYELKAKLELASTFAFVNTTMSAPSSTNAILVYNAKQGMVVVRADVSSYNGLTVSNPTTWDTFVSASTSSTNYDMGSYYYTGGLITIETGDDTGVVPTTNGWISYIESHKVPSNRIRYHFNVADLAEGYTYHSTSSTKEDLLYFSINHFISSNLKTRYYSTSANAFSAGGDIDLTGLCYYPPMISSSVTLDFNNHTLTFAAFSTTSSDSNYFSSSLLGSGKPCYGMQSALIAAIKAVSSSSINVVIRNIQITGTTSYVGDGGTWGGGVLTIGKIIGKETDGNVSTANVNIQNIYLNNLKTNYTDISSKKAFLLINMIGSYTNVTINGLTQYTKETYQSASKTNTYGSDYKGKYFALIGICGDSYNASVAPNSKSSKVSLTNIVLDSLRSTAIFRSAMFFNSINFAEGTFSYTYNFNLDEDWSGSTHLQNVTYAQELKSNAEQGLYYDSETVYVSPVSNSATSVYNFTLTTYYPYVANTALQINLSVNRKNADLKEGYGTYSYPYIINNPKQLLEIANIISGTFNYAENWTINYPLSSAGVLDLTSYEEYVVNGGILQTASGKTLSNEALQSYLQSAYYYVDVIELIAPTGFVGIGTASYPFHGVISGKSTGTTITMKTSPIVTKDGYGFVRVANGCAITNISVVYQSDIQMTTATYTTTSNATTGPQDTTNQTNLAYFGGAIGWVVGGDNYLENVTIEITSYVKGNYYSVFGGYVGLITGGGVVFNECGETNGAHQVGYSEFEKTLQNADVAYLYYNPFVGCVLNGYAISIDGQIYDNGDQHYTIPSIPNILSRTKIAYSTGTFTIKDDLDLLILSFAMNSGTLAVNSTQNAYGLGAKSRVGDYSQVGNVTTMILDSGKYLTDTFETPYLASCFTDASTASTAYSSAITIVFSNSTYDMSSYKNAFRGLGGYYAKSIQYNISEIKGTGASSAAITLNLNYFSRYHADNKIEPDSITYLGLVGTNRGNTVFTNLTLSGTISLKLYLVDVTSATSNVATETRNNYFTALTTNPSKPDNLVVGGFIALCNNPIFTDCTLSNLVVSSPDLAGGLCTYAIYTVSTNQTVFSSIEANNVELYSIRHNSIGIAYLKVNNKIRITIDDVTISNCKQDTCITNTDTILVSSASKVGMGTLFGLSEGGSSVYISNIDVSYSSLVSEETVTKQVKDTFYIGGLVGKIDIETHVSNVNLDGLVILANWSFVKTTGKRVTQDTKYASYYSASDSCYPGAGNLVGLMVSSGTYNNYSAHIGGIASEASAATYLDNIHITTNTGSFIISGMNSGALLVGQINSNVTYQVTNCSVQTTNHDIVCVNMVRSASVAGYCNSNSVVTVENCSFHGTETHPIYLLGTKHSSSTSCGLVIGENKDNTVNISNISGSYAVISAIKAGGYCGCDGSTLTINDLTLSNLIIYGKTYAGGVYSNITTARTQYMKNVILLNNVIEVGTSGKFSGGLIGEVLNASAKIYVNYVLMDSNKIGYTSSVNFINVIQSHFTTERQKTFNQTYGAFLTSNITGTLKAMCISRDETDANPFTDKIYSGTGTCTYSFSGYGAITSYYDALAIDPDNPLTAQEAIETRKVSVNDEESYLFGDSVTETNGTSTPIELADKTWKKITLDTLSKSNLMTTLGAQVEGITTNSALSIFYLHGNVNTSMEEYVNYLLGTDYKTLSTTITSSRYSVNKTTGVIANLGETGSVAYVGGQFVSSRYDNLAVGDTLSFTIISIQITNPGKTGNETYTLHIALYYPQILEMETNIIPIEGETYQISAFVGSGATNTISISGSVDFTLFIEYTYNNSAANVEDFNFAKYIWSTNVANTGNGTAVPAGTTLVLIDLNSTSPMGYIVYYLTLAQDSYSISFNSFSTSEGVLNSGCQLNLDSLIKFDAQLTSKDQVTERYLLFVDLPSRGDSVVSAYQYNFKAEVEDNDKNIIVDTTAYTRGTINIWGEARVEAESNTIASNIFSNDENTIKEEVTASITFPEYYIQTIAGKTKMYGTYVFSLKNASSKTLVFPQGTKVNYYDENGDLLLSDDVSGMLHATYSIGDIIAKIPNISATEYSSTISVEIDFSKVDSSDFNSTFSNDAYYTLDSSFYYSSDPSFFYSGLSDSSTSTYKASISSKIKAVATPTNTKPLGINVNDIEKSDSTNNGIIDFKLDVDYSSLEGEVPSSVSVSFALYEKKYNAVSGMHYYDDTINVLDSLGVIVSGGNEITSEDTLECLVNASKVSETLRLKLDLKDEDNLLKDGIHLTNYKLVITISREDSVGTVLSENCYFIFLLTDIYTEIVD